MTNKEINIFEEKIETSTSERDDAPLVEMLQKIKDRQEEEAQLALGRSQVKQVIEALLFSTNDPLSLKKLREITEEIFPLKPRVLEALLHELRDEYDKERRAFELAEIADGYILRTRADYGSYVDLLHHSRRGEKLSPAAAEVLAIIAYRQPITRVQIDAIRGVDSSGTVYSLLERGLVESVGRLEAPGRPTLFGTSLAFLKAFGLKSLNELPHREQLCKEADKLPRKR